MSKPDFSGFNFAEAYAAAINAVNDQGQKVEGEPISVLDPDQMRDRIGASE